MLSINSLAIDNSANVYAAGNFKNSSNYNYATQWNGTDWSEVGAGSYSLNVIVILAL